MRNLYVIRSRSSGTQSSMLSTVGHVLTSIRIGLQLALGHWAATVCLSAVAAAGEIDFNRDIRPILSNACFQCHGPDEAERKGGTDGLRLDTLAGAMTDLGGYAALNPGDPERSELLTRVSSDDPDLHMPPQDSGKKITAEEVDLLRKWIEQGAAYAPHWSYVKPKQPDLPSVEQTNWPRNAIDQFILARLEQTNHVPSEAADRSAIARRVCLDLTGLPPTLDEMQEFLQDDRPNAYERFVDRLLEKQSFGEHWARMWLDLARYADSAGYADDPARSIWLYRDYVIRSLNENKPFDQFTIEQIAGDLLPNPTPDQLIATAFHRNTMTNSEGGTNDEEFRNVAIVDRVNTTFSVWMGTTIACAQCHTHKFDPITQTEYFQIFAILNNTKDADRKDEAPLYSTYTSDQRDRQSRLRLKIQALEEELRTPTPELLAARDQWDTDFPRDLQWQPLAPLQIQLKSQGEASIEEDVVTVANGASQDVYTLNYPLSAGSLRALKLEVLPQPENAPAPAEKFVITKVSAELIPPDGESLKGRYLRISLPGEEKILSLAEVQVFQGERNIALAGAATQSSTAFDGAPERAIDDLTNGNYFESNSVTHTNQSNDPWWELDLLSEQEVDRIELWNRTDGNVGSRLADFQVELLNADRQVLWKQLIKTAPAPALTLIPGGKLSLEFSSAVADDTQKGFSPEFVLQNPDPKKLGWAIGSAEDKPHSLTLITSDAIRLTDGWTLNLTIEQLSENDNSTLRRFRVAATSDERARLWGEVSQPVAAALENSPEERTPEQQQVLLDHFLKTTTLLAPQRKKLEELRKQLTSIKKVTVPVCEELPADQQRKTHLQLRGNYLVQGDEVGPGTPAAFPPIPENYPTNRLGLAYWLVDNENPLTARVIANRYWEKIFGTGLVLTSEDFGSQGEPPSHPELLDWLATEMIRLNWDTKAFLKLLVTSAAYRQSSFVTNELYQEDPDNRLLARGPRFRHSAENIRDQALALSGLLSSKMYGEPVKPPQPSSGLSAAFGATIDWKTSQGEDKYRRAIYTNWRRSNPYPSMTTFDAPNREICTVRRSRTNTPLQALVTLNDPVYVEAAQALARRIVTEGGDTSTERMRFALQLCLARSPHSEEVSRLVDLHQKTLTHFQNAPELAVQLATDPLGPLPEGMEPIELAAWTVVANVILNLDEVLMKR